jgi:hypothetical protein
MYLRPDEVASVLESVGFVRDYMDEKTYGYQRGEHYVYVNREARLGRTALIIHPGLKELSARFAQPTSSFRSSSAYRQFPLDLQSDKVCYYGIGHGFSSRKLLSDYLNQLFK